MQEKKVSSASNDTRRSELNQIKYLDGAEGMYNEDMFVSSVKLISSILYIISTKLTLMFFSLCL